MPVLHQHKTQFHYYILTSIDNQVVTFKVSVNGVAKLRAAGVGSGQTFSRGLFFSLYREGDLSTAASGAMDASESVAPQVEFDFAEDLTRDTEFPRCDCCSKVFGISLIVVKTVIGSAGEIACSDCFRNYGLANDFQMTLPIPQHHLVESRLYLQKLSRKTANVTRLEQILRAVS